MKLRAHEWMIVAFFAYVAAISPLFTTRPLLHGQPWLLLGAVLITFFCIAQLQKTVLARGMSIARDWLPLLFVILAFREMNYFMPREYDLLTEMSWVRWDLILLEGFKLRQHIESLGLIIPTYLEACYLTVYAVPVFCVAFLASSAGRLAINRFWTIFLLGTLAAYALFPYFPTEPPRDAFPDVAMPAIASPLHSLNIFVLNHTTIHSGVFPSAHVSAAFDSAFAMILLLPGRRWIGGLMLFYAFSVAVATLYGRYHYFVDVIAGFALSLLAAALCFLYFAYDVKQATR